MRNFKFLLICMIAPLLLSSCSSRHEAVKMMFEYNQSFYESIHGWYINDAGGEKIQIVSCDSKKYHSAWLYSDVQERFALVQLALGDVLLHKVDDFLPSFKDVSCVEKIVVDFYDVGNKDICLIGQELLDILSDMAVYEEQKQTDKSIQNLGTINIYFSNYPAHYFYGHIIKTSDGKWGIYALSPGLGGIVDEYMICSNQTLFKNCN